MKNGKILKSKETNEGSNQLFRYSLTTLSSGMVWKRLARTGLPVLLALFVITGLIFHTRLWNVQIPSVKNGVLDLSKWNGEKEFVFAGEWEFYWGKLLNDEQINSGRQTPMLVNAPDKWNNYQIEDTSLPGKGKATYRIRITGAKAGTQYGVRIQSMASAYRLYMHGMIIAQNGYFGDDETAPSSAYRPQLAAFTPTRDSFDLVLQVSNDVYGLGGMWEPIIFGTYQQVTYFDRLLSNIVTSAMTGLIVSCLFFLIFFTAQRGEKDALILSILSLLILFRLSIIGDIIFSILFPNVPIT